MQNVHIVLGAPKIEKIKPLLIEEGLVIGVDRGALFAVEEGIKLDIAMGDFDSITDYEKKTIQKYSKKMLEDPNQELTDAEMALHYANDSLEAENIYIYNWYGGRVDHLYSLLLLVLQENLYDLIPKIHFISKENYISYYLPGAYKINKANQMEYLSFILLTKIKRLTIENVKYPLSKKNYNHPLALVSNEFINEEAFFSFTEGIIAVVQSRDS